MKLLLLSLSLLVAMNAEGQKRDTSNFFFGGSGTLTTPPNIVISSGKWIGYDHNKHQPTMWSFPVSYNSPLRQFTRYSVTLTDTTGHLPYVEHFDPYATTISLPPGMDSATAMRVMLASFIQSLKNR